MNVTCTQFAIGQLVRHREVPFRGVVVDVDPEYASNEAAWEAIPEDQRPRRDQPFYHVIAESDTEAYHAYVSEQHLLGDDSGEPLHNPQLVKMLGEFRDGAYHIPERVRH